MRVERISLSAFRGINGGLTLDFSSPLTLIYAPNGTGKTSICDAVEWLLTGEIARLAASREDEIAQLRCKFALPDIEMKVNGFVETSSGPLLLTRTPQGWFFSEAGAAKVSATASQVLALLSPPALVSDEAHHTQVTKIRRDWIRGARLFTEHTRSILLDADEVNIKTRERVLTDLLGVGELTTRADKLRKFADYLNAGYPPEKGLAALRKELAKQEEVLAQLGEKLKGSVSQGTTLYDCAFDELNAAALCLSVKTDGAADFEALLVYTRAFQQNEKHRVAERRRQLDKILEWWPEIPALGVSTAKAKANVAELSDKLSAINAEVKQCFEAAIEQSLTVDKDKERLANLLHEKSNIMKAVEAVQFSPRFITHFEDSTLASELFSLLPPWLEEGIAKKKALIVECRQGMRTKDADAKALEVVRKRLQDAEEALVTEEAVNGLRNEAILARTDVFKKREKYARLTGPFEDLRLATHVFIQSNNTGSDCPVCGHNWESTNELLKAISGTLENSPEMVLQLEQEVLEAERAAKALTSMLETAEASRSQHFEIKEELSAVTQKIERHNWVIAELRERLSTECLAGTKQYHLTPQLLPEVDIEMVEQETDLIEAIFTFQSKLRRASVAVVESEWLDLNLHEIKLLLEQKEATLEDLIRCGEMEAERKDFALGDLKIAEKGANESLQFAREVLQQKLPLWEKIKETWYALTGNAEYTEGELDKVTAAIREEEERVFTADGHLQTVQSALEAGTVQKEIDAREKELGGLRGKITVLARTREHALKAATLLESKANRYCYDQTNQLFDVAYPMFSRVHSNEVFDRIYSGSLEDPFTWVAESLNHQFSPSTHFSMGQRQDLALAIFLSRARSLGGTFLLDEPVIHLDDLNRIALLDMFRVLVTESGASCNFVVTTANKALVRHLVEKFSCVPQVDGKAPLFIYELDGNPKFGVTVKASRAVGGISQ